MPTIPKGPTGKPARRQPCAVLRVWCIRLQARINLAKKLDLDPLEGVPKELHVKLLLSCLMGFELLFCACFASR